MATALEFLGCFLQSGSESVEVLKDFKGEFKPSQGGKTTQACAELAKGAGYTYFGVGENQLTCFASGNLNDLKGDAAPKKKCSSNNLGKKGALAIYKIK